MPDYQNIYFSCPIGRNATYTVNDRNRLDIQLYPKKEQN